MQILFRTEMKTNYTRLILSRPNVVCYLVRNILETRSRFSICSILVFHISERYEIEHFQY